MDPHVAEQTTTAAAHHSTNIIVNKGKRTKRQRQQQSSIPFTISTSNNNINANFNNSSPASSSDFPAGSTTTEEEDTAKCLILLSKGHNINNNHDFKFNSKRYIQTPNHDHHGFTGIYVYECKTCSRTFPSFQALGGHRASHRKPRINEDKKRPPPYTVFSDDDEPSALQFPSKKNNSSSSSSLSLQLNTKKSSSKLHECSICGTEFNSGQALGGHMRRHRVATTSAAAATTTNTTLSLIPYTTMVADDQDNHKSRNDGLCLDLDLNLPAPPETTIEDHRRGSSFTFTANPTKQQSAVHLSTTPTLVDCHY